MFSIFAHFREKPFCQFFSKTRSQDSLRGFDELLTAGQPGQTTLADTTLTAVISHKGHRPQ